MIVLASFILLLAAACVALVLLSCRRMRPWSALPVGRRRATAVLSGFAILCPVVGIALTIRQWPMQGVVIPWTAIGMTCNTISVGIRSSKRV